QLGRVDVLDVDQQVRPEAGAAPKPLAEAVVQLAVGALAARGRRPDPRRVLAEVEGDPARRATKRAGADPDDLARRAELVEPGGGVGAAPAWQHVALPRVWRQRHALERDQDLAEAIDAGAAGRRAVDALPLGLEAGERALLDRLDLAPQCRQRGAAQAP